MSSLEQMTASHEIQRTCKGWPFVIGIRACASLFEGNRFVVDFNGNHKQSHPLLFLFWRASRWSWVHHEFVTGFSWVAHGKPSNLISSNEIDSL